MQLCGNDLNYLDLIYLFSLYILFSQLRSRDALKKTWLLSSLKLCIHMHVDARLNDDIWKKQFYRVTARG